MTLEFNIHNHPCFNDGVRHLYGRIHLPVAPRCNIQCNFCNRKYDCPNESRPGVTRAVLSPRQALYYLETAMAKNPHLTVAGIAGPGDPFANPEETLNTLRMVHDQFPNLLTCVASNGLNILPFIDDLAACRVSHVTLTVNVVDPDIGQKIYAWVRDHKVIYRGRDAAALLLDRQLRAVKELKRNGITVKINSIIIPGVNDGHIAAVSRTMAAMGADIMNAIPIYAIPDTPFAAIEPPNAALVSQIRNEAAQYLPQMEHCARCRADAAGLIGAPDRESGEDLAAVAQGPLNPAESRPNLAIASLEGILVNQHLGEAAHLKIYQKTETGFAYLEERATPEPGGGERRWAALARTLSDCSAVLAGSAGDSPKSALARAGIKVYETQGLIQEILDAFFLGQEPPKTRRFSCGSSCKGNGAGCG